MGIYVHWPYCARICPYCDFNVVRDRGQTEQIDLGRAIITDLEAQAARLGERKLVSIFLGGGTPSLMRPDQVAAIIDVARRLWPGAGDIEISLEANPTDAEAGRFTALADAGVGRLSLGVQALDEASLTFLGRNHSADEAVRAVSAAAAAFPRVSLDLIYARPGQTAAAWADELARAVDLGAEHISPYQLTIEAGTAFDRAVRRGAWTPVDPDLAADLYETTQSVLEARGFEAYEVSNHARGAAARSAHNLLYWTGGDYIGVGPGAHGRLTLNEGRIATAAERSVGGYLQRVEKTGTGLADEHFLSLREAAEERLLMGLRTAAGVALSELAPVGLHAGSSRIAAMCEVGLLDLADGRIAATAAGRMVLDRLTTELAIADGGWTDQALPEDAAAV